MVSRYRGRVLRQTATLTTWTYMRKYVFNGTASQSVNQSIRTHLYSAMSQTNQRHCIMAETRLSVYDRQYQTVQFKATLRSAEKFGGSTVIRQCVVLGCRHRELVQPVELWSDVWGGDDTVEDRRAVLRLYGRLRQSARQRRHSLQL